MKKLLLSLGALSAVVAPVAAVVACGSKTETPAKTNPDTTSHMSAATKVSTKTKDALSHVTQTEVETASKTAGKLIELLGLPDGSFTAMAGSTYVWNAQDLTLTYKKLMDNKPYGSVITVTPKAAPVVAGLNTGDFVTHAFADHATFANLAGLDNAGEFTSAIKGISGGTLEEIQIKIKTFNEGNHKVSQEIATANDWDLIDSLVGKSLKAELFYQQDDRGGMTFVGAGKLDATIFPDAATATLDTDNAHHGTALHKYGIRFVTV